MTNTHSGSIIILRYSFNQEEYVLSTSTTHIYIMMIKKEIKKVQGRLTFTNNHKLKRCR